MKKKFKTVQIEYELEVPAPGEALRFQILVKLFKSEHQHMVASSVPTFKWTGNGHQAGM